MSAPTRPMLSLAQRGAQLDAPVCAPVSYLTELPALHRRTVMQSAFRFCAQPSSTCLRGLSPGRTRLLGPFRTPTTTLAANGGWWDVLEAVCAVLQICQVPARGCPDRPNPWTADATNHGLVLHQDPGCATTDICEMGPRPHPINQSWPNGGRRPPSQPNKRDMQIFFAVACRAVGAPGWCPRLLEATVGFAQRTRLVVRANRGTAAEMGRHLQVDRGLAALIFAISRSTEL
jgi:hypothetical protein